MITRDDLIVELKTLLGATQPEDADDKLKVHLRNISYQLSNEFSSLLTRSANLTADADGVVTFPDDCSFVYSCWIGDTEIQPVNHTDFQRYSTNGITNDVIKIEERAGNWIGTLNGASTSAGTVLTVIYRISPDRIDVLPDYYRRVLMLGACADFLLFEDMGDTQKESKMRSRYNQAVRELRIIQAHNTNLDIRLKSQFEIDWNRALRTLIVANDRDVQ